MKVQISNLTSGIIAVPDPFNVNIGANTSKVLSISDQQVERVKTSKDIRKFVNAKMLSWALLDGSEPVPAPQPVPEPKAPTKAKPEEPKPAAPAAVKAAEEAPKKKAKAAKKTKAKKEEASKAEEPKADDDSKETFDDPTEA